MKNRLLFSFPTHKRMVMFYHFQFINIKGLITDLRYLRLYLNRKVLVAF